MTAQLRRVEWRMGDTEVPVLLGVLVATAVSATLWLSVSCLGWIVLH